MLTVIPIQDKNTQRELLELCGIDFDIDAFAYKAEDGGFLGAIQFKFVDGIGEISGFNYAPGTKDNEAMIIMLRTAMNFMFRCGIKSSTLNVATSSEELIKLSGYSRLTDNIYSIDLEKFYISPCHFAPKDNK